MLNIFKKLETRNLVAISFAGVLLISSVAIVERRLHRSGSKK